MHLKKNYLIYHRKYQQKALNHCLTTWFLLENFSTAFLRKHTTFLKKVSKMGPISSIGGTSGVKTPSYSGDTKRNEERGIWWKTDALEREHTTVTCISCREGVVRSHYLAIWSPQGCSKCNGLGPIKEHALKEKRHLPGDHLCRDSNPEPLD